MQVSDFLCFILFCKIGAPEMYHKRNSEHIAPISGRFDVVSLATG